MQQQNDAPAEHRNVLSDPFFMALLLAIIEAAIMEGAIIAANA